MIRIVTIAVAALGGFMLSAWGVGQGEDPPSHGALPQGHPPVAWSHPALPQGHPLLDAPRAVLPPGHPPLPPAATPRCPALERRSGGGLSDGAPTTGDVISI
jgi:hypothetical protein